MSMMAATLLILSAGATGQGAPELAAAKPEAAKDQDDPMICQTDNVLGSRLKRKRICMRRSEWQRQHLEDKQMIDRTQVLRGLNPAG